MRPDALPLYEEIARDLISAIDAGAHPVGSLLPTEFELVERYGVSRQTVRMAMRRLAEIGAVSRRQGAGTRVEERRAPTTGFQQTLGSLADLTALAAATVREVVRIDALVMDKAQARLFGCAPGSRWSRLSYIRRHAKGSRQALGWVDVHVDERYAAVLGDLGDSHLLVSDLIEKRFGVRVGEVHQDVAATAIDAEKAVALDTAQGTP
ncbi:MAG: GntR family transcriptional regulator, partial [Bosea sp. (in: a-proteobacteria)]